jgi:hypothetical protein
MISLSNVVLPPFAKWAALAALTVAIWGYGYVNGIERTNDRIVEKDVKIIYKQGKITTKVITKYIKEKQKQAVIDKEIKQDGQSFAIKYPDGVSPFNNEYVWLYDNSVKGSISPLPSGNPGDSSGVTVSESLSVGIHNNTVARQWKERALTCELWAQEQERATTE